jgi:hypothetical protein
MEAQVELYLVYLDLVVEEVELLPLEQVELQTVQPQEQVEQEQQTLLQGVP